ncbi:conjugal transfer protein TraF [Halioxenophilus aromaticivorans]
MPSLAEDVRSMGMGGTGVASANGDTAAIMNPALMTGGPLQAGWSFVGPSLVVEASDRHDIADTVDDMTDAYDELDLAIQMQDVSSSEAYKDAFLQELAELDNKPVTLKVNTELALTMPLGEMNLALGGRSTLDVTVIADYVSDDETLIENAIISGNADLLEDSASSVTGVGVVVSEAYVALAHGATWQDQQLSFSVAPKYQELQTIYYKSTAGSYDQDDLDADDYVASESGFNLDLGMAYYITPKVNAGLTLRNVLGGDYDTIAPGTISPRYAADEPLRYELNPKATVGVAYNGSMLTLAADLDLTEDSGFAGYDRAQFARLGAELNFWNWAAVRVGYRHDMNDVQENVVTAGLAFSPFNTFHFGLSSSYSENNTAGVGAEFKLTL